MGGKWLCCERKRGGIAWGLRPVSQPLRSPKLMDVRRLRGCPRGRERERWRLPGGSTQLPPQAGEGLIGDACWRNMLGRQTDAASFSAPWRRGAPSTQAPRPSRDGLPKIAPTSAPIPSTRSGASTRSRTPPAGRQPLNLSELLLPASASATDPSDSQGKIVLHFYVR